MILWNAILRTLILRESPELRKEIYDAINEDPGMSYEQLALKHGFNLNKKMDL